jgi:SAM-dependent methyltransferase
MKSGDVTTRELEHHEALYSGFAQAHFAKPAVRAFRRHLAGRILRLTALDRSHRVLSLGCGIGDTELLVAPHAAELVGVDLSPAAIRQARADALRAGLSNVRFLAGDLQTLALPPRSFDVILAVFVLHHLPDAAINDLARRVARLLRPGGVFYSLDPSRYRLSGAVGRLLVPGLMRRYQSPDERELVPEDTCRLFREAGLEAQARIYDFLSTPCAGLFPSAAFVYRLARMADELLVRLPLVRLLGSNFEIIAYASR